MLIPAGKKAGDSWADSSNTNGIKVNNTYTLKQINGNEALVTVSTISNINKIAQAQGTELTITMDSKISSDNTVDVTTGLVKEKKVTVKSYIVPGGHTWMNCKAYLTTTLQELFK